MALTQGSLVLHRLICEKLKKKLFLCETRRHRPPVFGMWFYQSHILCKVSISPNLLKLSSMPTYCRIHRPKIFKIYWLPYPYVSFFRNVTITLLRTNISGELQNHWSSGLPNAEHQAKEQLVPT